MYIKYICIEFIIGFLLGVINIGFVVVFNMVGVSVGIIEDFVICIFS